MDARSKAMLDLTDARLASVRRVRPRALWSCMEGNTHRKHPRRNLTSASPRRRAFRAVREAPRVRSASANRPTAEGSSNSLWPRHRRARYSFPRRRVTVPLRVSARRRRARHWRSAAVSSTRTSGIAPASGTSGPFRAMICTGPPLHRSPRLRSPRPPAADRPARLDRDASVEPIVGSPPHQHMPMRARGRSNPAPPQSRREAAAQPVPARADGPPFRRTCEPPAHPRGRIQVALRRNSHTRDAAPVRAGSRRCRRRPTTGRLVAGDERRY